MSIPSASTVPVRDASSGRIHLRTRVEGRLGLEAFEGCNSDDAGDFTEITDAELVEAEPGSLCERCFPPAPEGV